jgi:DNA-binding winged helix-turn-helix (wHTH) protein/Tfp pilus assembly protein PilF
MECARLLRARLPEEVNVHGLRLRGRLVVPELGLIARNGTAVHVEPKTMEVLLELARYPGEVVSKTQIIQSVWHGVFVCEDVVTNAISLLRRALADEAKSPSLIETIAKRGYRLMAPVVREAAEDALPEVPAVAGARLGDLRLSLLRVRYLRHEETLESLNSACAYCEEIIRQEPNCAGAYAELVLALFLLEKLGAVEREDIEAKVRRAVDHALCLDERASMSLVCRAKQEYRYDWKWDKAEEHFRRAAEADPGEADAFAEFSIMLAVMRRFDESLAHARRACSLDSFSPAARLQAGHAHYASGQWTDAAVQYRRLLRFTPQHVFARWGLADSLDRDGRPQEAIAVLREGLSMAGAGANPLILTSLARIESALAPSSGRSLASQQLQEHTSDPVLLAEFYGSLGEPARAFAMLDQAADMRHYRLSAVNMFPQFEILRQDPRYRRLRERIGLRG